MYFIFFDEMTKISSGIIFTYLTFAGFINRRRVSFVFSILSPAWIGSGASTINDLVMPRMRATASAYYVLMNTFLGLALGPYLMGQISDMNVASGMASGDALREAVAWGLLMFIVSAVFLSAAMKYLENDERTRLDRARALGEPEI